jgi:hypothetical protein
MEPVELSESTPPGEPGDASAERLRARAQELRSRSRELRGRSAEAFRRSERALQRLELRRELLRSEFAQMRALLRDARVELAQADDDDLQGWMGGEVLEMIVAGWGRRELAEVGIGPQLLRELRLYDHPRLGSPPPVRRRPAR